MRPYRIVVLGLAVLAAATSVTAQEIEPEADIEPAFECTQPDIPVELAQLCASLDLGYADVMSRPAQVTGNGRPAVKPSTLRRPIRSQIITNGLTPAPTLDHIKNPFEGPTDRTVGVQVNATEAPIQFSTRMVQPGSASDTTLNWELKAESQAEQSGLFMGAATGGTQTAGGMSENLAGFAGIRRIIRPTENTKVRAEIAPRFGVSDFAAPHTTAALEPKLSAESDLGQLGSSDFVGSINASAGYNMPAEGDTSAWGSLRLTVRPK